jgi:alpha-L-arabinofuranosidase
MRASVPSRREVLKSLSTGSLALGLSASPSFAGNSNGSREASNGNAAPRDGGGSRPTRTTKAELHIDPTPRFDLSPWLYMQFMEPLGVTDSSVAAAWNAKDNRWREDVIDVTRRLGTPLLRWGGILSAYYRWKEGVGPRDKRKPMVNLCWGGVETNQVGTHEFVDFCRRAGAEPFYCVNFESEGNDYWKKMPDGDVRTAGPDEAAEWVDYCNNPDNAERRANGAAEPFNLRLWQLGNETSYSEHNYDVETAAKRTVAFAKAMRAKDANIELIGWGDSGWARRMMEIAGEHLQYLAFHHHFGSGLPDSPLHGTAYRKDPDLTWQHLMHAHKSLDTRLGELREEIKGLNIPLAMTEGHFALQGRNRCEVLSSWAAGVANARILNVQARNGDLLKIATLADFCGTRWQNNAVMIPVPGGRSFMMPVAKVMSLYRHHAGEEGVDVDSTPDELDVTASRSGQKFYLHVVNTERTRSVDATLHVDGEKIKSGRVYTLAADPEIEVFEHRDDVLEPVEKPLPDDGKWTFPAASVSVVELVIEDAVDEAGS